MLTEPSGLLEPDCSFDLKSEVKRLAKPQLIIAALASGMNNQMPEDGWKCRKFWEVVGKCIFIWVFTHLKTRDNHFDNTITFKQTKIQQEVVPEAI